MIIECEEKRKKDKERKTQRKRNKIGIPIFNLHVLTCRVLFPVIINAIYNFFG